MQHSKIVAPRSTPCSSGECGWGAGLLQHDLIDRFLLFYYSNSARTVVSISVWQPLKVGVVKHSSPLSADTTILRILAKSGPR